MQQTKSAVLVFVLALLSACATATRTQAPSPAKQAPKADEGVVVLSVTGNTGQVRQFNDIALIRQQAAGTSSTQKAQYILTQSSAGLSRDTAIFVGVLPAGEYTFDRFTDPKTNQYLQLSDGGREILGAFKVRAGALSDLGRIIATPINFKIFVGRSDLVRSNKELVKRFVPEVEKYYAGEVNEGWIRPRGNNDIAERYALTHPVGAAGLVEIPNGEVAAASRMGTVLLRNAAGRWRRVGGKRLESLFWVAPYNEGDSRLLAVGEFNTLVRMDRRETLHPMDTGNLPPGNLLFIDGNNSAGWYVAHVSGDDVTIYRSASLAAPTWEPIRSEKTGTSMWHGLDQFWIAPTSKGFMYAVSKGDIHAYDYGTRTWTQRRAPKEHRLLKIEVSPGDVWGIITSPGGGFGGIFSSTYFSRDLGATWVETKSPFKVKASAPKITPKGTLLEAGGMFGKGGLQASKDEGKTWSQVVEKSVLSDTLWVMPTVGLFLVSDGSLGIDRIEHSRDDGTSWTIEHSTFEKSIYDIQEKKK